VLHNVAPDHCSGPAQPRLAMDGDGAGGLFALGQKLRQNVVRRIRPVHEVQLHVFDPVVAELAAVVGGLVQSHDQGDVALLEIGDIVFRSQGVISS
jgi:hypothetical protein